MSCTTAGEKMHGYQVSTVCGLALVFLGTAGVISSISVHTRSDITDTCWPSDDPRSFALRKNLLTMSQLNTVFYAWTEITGLAVLAGAASDYRDLCVAMANGHAQLELSMYNALYGAMLGIVAGTCYGGLTALANTMEAGLKDCWDSAPFRWYYLTHSVGLIMFLATATIIAAVFCVALVATFYEGLCVVWDICGNRLPLPNSYVLDRDYLEKQAVGVDTSKDTAKASACV